MSDWQRTLDKIKAKAQIDPNLSQSSAQRAQHQILCTKGPGCEVCQGSGYFRESLPLHHPNFGKLQRCPYFDIMGSMGASQYGLTGAEVESLDWGQILALPGSQALTAVAKVKEIMARGWGLVYLYGAHGQAKTLILKVAVAEWLRSGVQSNYANMAEILAYLRAAFDSERPSYEAQGRLDKLASVKLLAIDEWGRINDTAWGKESQFRLFDKRYTDAIRQDTITLVASNISPERLDSYYASRFLDSRCEVIPLYGQDQRQNMTEDISW